MVVDDAEPSSSKHENLIFLKPLARRQFPFAHSILVEDSARRPTNTFRSQVRCREYALSRYQDEDSLFPRLISAIKAMLSGWVEREDAIDTFAICEYRVCKNASSDASSEVSTTWSSVRKEQMSTSFDSSSSIATAYDASSWTVLEDAPRVAHSLPLSLAFHFFPSSVAKYWEQSLYPWPSFLQWKQFIASRARGIILNRITPIRCTRNCTRASSSSTSSSSTESSSSSKMWALLFDNPQIGKPGFLCAKGTNCTI